VLDRFLIERFQQWWTSSSDNQIQKQALKLLYLLIRNNPMKVGALFELLLYNVKLNPQLCGVYIKFLLQFGLQNLDISILKKWSETLLNFAELSHDEIQKCYVLMLEFFSRILNMDEMSHLRNNIFGFVNSSPCYLTFVVL